MESIRNRMAIVAIAVCGFAIGMAALLDYFKYRSTAERIVERRLQFIGNSIENSIQSSLAIGMQFADLGTLPETLERERANDGLIVGIDVFDTEGQPLYSTDNARTAQTVPAAWIGAARRVPNADWTVRDAAYPAVGIAVQNHFGLTIGHLALRYSHQRVQAAALQVARELALNALAVFAGASLLAALAVGGVMRRLESEVGAVEGALRGGDAALAAAASRSGPFGAAMRRFVTTVRAVEAEIVGVRARLQRGARP